MSCELRGMSYEQGWEEREGEGAGEKEPFCRYRAGLSARNDDVHCVWRGVDVSSGKGVLFRGWTGHR